MSRWFSYEEWEQSKESELLQHEAVELLEYKHFSDVLEQHSPEEKIQIRAKEEKKQMTLIPPTGNDGPKPAGWSS